MKETKSRTSFAKMVSKNKKAVFIPIILAVVVGHFLIQMSFIQGKKTSESLTAAEPDIAGTTPQSANNKSPQIDANTTDIVETPKLRKTSQPVQIVQKETSRKVQTATVQNSWKKEVKRDAKSERLRHAEKILTGF